MAVLWRRLCYATMAVNAGLMLATLTVAAVRFTQPRAQPSTCPPGLGTTVAMGGVSTSAPHSTAETDVMILTRETMLQAVQDRHNNYQEAERFRTMTPQGDKLLAHVMLESSQSCIIGGNLHWDANHTQSILQGFQYDQRGYLCVPKDGCYFIYAHLHYMDKPGYGFDRDRLKDFILKNEKRFVDDPDLREKLKKKLLFNQQTPCKVVSPAIPLPSSYQGKVVCLKRDDMLSVASCLPENLHNEAARSYFGVHLL